MAPQDAMVRPLTKADFYAFIATEPEGRFEFDGERIIDMTGGTRNHSSIGTRFVLAVGRQLDEAKWMVHGPDRGVETPTTVRYPDAIVNRNSDAGKSRWTQGPVLIVEVLSPSSGRTDLVTKVKEYSAFPMLEGYIVADPDRPHCHIWVRDAAGQFPSQAMEVAGADGVIAVPNLGLRIELAFVYRHLLAAGA